MKSITLHKLDDAVAHELEKRARDQGRSLNSTAQDIRRYDQLYESKVAELADAEEELEDAESQIANLKLIKTGLENEKATLQSQKRDLEQQIRQLNDRIDDLRDDVNYYKDKYNCCENDPPNCASC